MGGGQGVLCWFHQVQQWLDWQCAGWHYVVVSSHLGLQEREEKKVTRGQIRAVWGVGKEFCVGFTKCSNGWIGSVGGGIIMVEQVAPPTILLAPQVWPLSSDLLPQTPQSLTVVFSPDCLTHQNKLMVQQPIAIEEGGQHSGPSGPGVKSLLGSGCSPWNPLCAPDFGLRVKGWQGAFITGHNASQELEALLLESLQVLLTHFLAEPFLFICQNPGNEFRADMSQLQVLAQDTLDCRSGYSCLHCQLTHRLPSVGVKLGLHFVDVICRTSSAGTPTSGGIFGVRVDVSSLKLLVPEAGLSFSEGAVSKDKMQLLPADNGCGTLSNHKFDDRPLLKSALH